MTLPPALTCRWHAQDIGTIATFLSPAECKAYVRLSETVGYEDAPVSTAEGMVMLKDLRNNDRVMLDDVARAADLWQRIRPFVPPRFKKKWQPVGVNERLRFYRYDVGQQFDWHHDGYFERANGERSFFTFMVYLNEDFEGGETSFAAGSTDGRSFESFPVSPRTGMALLFHHPIAHKGEPVRRGRKYVLRTDIMFARRERE
jgi:hypothetical protein